MRAGTTLRAPAIVCVAASTGGPPAVTAFLDALGGTPPCPVLIVQHMPGSFTGRFAERLDRRADLEVHEARSGAVLRAGEILVAPGDRHLRIRHGRVRLTDEPPIAGLRPRADLTFADLADEYGTGAAVVVLSGMGSDGYDGAAAIAAAGGQVLAQDAASCTVDGMPSRIRAEGLADLIGPPADLARALDHAWHDADRPGATRVTRSTPPTAGGEGAADPTIAAAPEVAVGGRRRSTTADDPDAVDVERVFTLLRRLEAVDLRPFKQAQLVRTIRSFADQHGIDVDHLARRLDPDADLRRRLLDRLTINVTSFFRDVDRWRDLDRLVVPQLGPNPRVWNPGCADGSETCTLAMLLVESGRRPRIWATDLNPARIEAARTGRYADDAVADLPPRPDGTDRRERWFRPDGDRWVVDAGLASVIRYDRHDALAGPVGGAVEPPFDLVVCRNLVIYLTTAGRDRLLDGIADSLADDGALLLGNAERILRPERFGLTRLSPGLYRRDPGAHP